MIHIFLAWVAAGIIRCISSAGYPGVIFLMLIESACIPIPSEIIMTFSGYLVSTGRFSLLAVVLFGNLGELLGATLIYALASTGGRSLIEKYGPYLLISHRHLAQADAFFQKHGDSSVFVGRLLPVVRTFISLPAGVTRVPFLRFCLLTLLGSFPWCFALAYAGMLLGKNWELIGPYFHFVDFPLLFLIIFGIAWWIWKERPR